MSTSPEQNLPKQSFTPETEMIKDPSDTTKDLIESLLSRLEFTVTPELAEATQAVLEALVETTDDPRRLQQAWIEYAKIGEQLVERGESFREPISVHAKSQLGIIIHKALIFRTVNDVTRYVEELDSAHRYAYNQTLSFPTFQAEQRYYNDAIADDPTSYTRDTEMEDMSDLLADERDRLMEGLELSPVTLVIKLSGEISDGNLEFLRDCIDAGDDLEDMIGHAYSAIIAFGHDPDEVLTRLRIIEPKP